MAAKPSFMPAVFYQDPRAALAWLERAFGFEVSMLLTDAEGGIAHAEMSYGNGLVAIGTEWTDWARSPKSTGGVNTQLIEVPPGPRA